MLNRPFGEPTTSWKNNREDVHNQEFLPKESLQPRSESRKNLKRILKRRRQKAR
jgi:hypothetical protein